MNDTDYDAIVIGCGHNGLVAAYYLAAAGFRVLGFERGSKVGGAATTEEIFPGYQFATCAHSFSVMHPKIIDDLGLLDLGLEISPRDPSMFHPFLDGRHLILWNDLEKTQESIARISTHDAQALPGYFEFWRRAGALFEPYLLTAPPTHAEFMQRVAGTSEEEIAYALITGSRRALLDEHFESPEVKAALGTTFDTGSTDGAGGLLYFAFAQAIGSQLSARGLSGHPRGGMGAVMEAMRRAAENAGAEIETSSPVKRVLIRDGQAFGVEKEDGTEITARAVMSSADPRLTFLGLVGADNLPGEFVDAVRNLRAAAGYMKLMCAVDGLPDWTALPGAEQQPHHFAHARICESLEDIDRAWIDARAGRVPSACVLGVVTHTLYDDEMAPSGRHAISIWAEYAPIRPVGASWGEVRDRVSRDLIAQVGKYAPTFPEIVQQSRLHSPSDIEAQAGITDGSMHHIDMTVDQMLARRPVAGWSDYRTPVKSLYLCGSGCHPGGGVTGLPGHNAAHAVIRDLA
jgi:phytoene dehydrogenase-like protein